MVPTPATMADVPAVMLLIGRVFAEYGLLLMPAFEVPDLLRFDEHYTPPRGAFWIVRDDSRVVGSVGVDRVDAHTAELHRLYVDASARGRGIGRVLVETVLDWAREQGIPRLVLWSDTRFETSHRLYRRLGFEQRGERTVEGDINASRELRYERDV
ncbi:MAG TPA: GNAT family N-acetyltransferase [Methylomirabilota bacterium]|nr:GNAT family N-acetyltransferase [Methylomirabilota bacterium]